MGPYEKQEIVENQRRIQAGDALRMGTGFRGPSSFRPHRCAGGVEGTVVAGTGESRVQRRRVVMPAAGGGGRGFAGVGGTPFAGRFSRGVTCRGGRKPIFGATGACKTCSEPRP